MIISQTIFWISVLALAYVYAGYPLLVCLWARLRPALFRSGRIEPTVSVLLVAHNEADRIESRLANLLAMDYPPDRLEILVGSDGSTDDTVARASLFRRRGVTMRAYPVRRGKPAVLDDLAASARGEILVLADARQRFDRGVLRALIRPFADPHVGAVSGELILGGEGDAGGEGVGLYWRLEKMIRQQESRIDSTVGATGAIYAVRRNLFEPIPHDTILDDVLVPMRVAARSYRVIFEPAARAYDRVAATSRDEFTRKVRTIAGNFQLFAREPWLLDPFRNRLWVQTVSHKALRLAGPLFLVAAMAANIITVLLIGAPIYRMLLIGQLLFYLGALACYALPNAARRVRPLVVPYVVCLLNWATIVAFFRFVSGRQLVTWDRVERPQTAGSRHGRAATLGAAGARQIPRV